MSAEASAALHAAAALLCLLWAGAALLAGRGRAALVPAAACAATAAWAGAVALAPLDPLSGLPGALEVLRTAAWAGLLLALMARGPAPAQARRFAPLVAALAVAALALDLVAPAGDVALPSVGSPSLLLRLGLALMVLVLAENLWRNADEQATWHVNLPCIALGGLSALDVVLYADAALSEAFSPALLDARAGIAALALSLLALSAFRDRRWKRGPAVSREVVFHGATLLVSGAFLLGVGTVGEALRRSGTEWSNAAQIGLLAGAVMALAVALASRSVRSRIRRAVVDHFFSARFDYRREWLRCVATLSEAGAATPERRAVRAVADAVDSPAGVLLLRGEDGELRWAGSWNLPAAPVPPEAARALAERLSARPAVELGPGGTPPGLAEAYGPLWLAVGLPHRDGPLGLALLAPPRAPFPLDEEVFALLAALGREVAMFLAEREAAERLADQRRIAEYAQRFAFVAHDVKTVSAQLRLMLDNAGPNIGDPEFQQDLLTTLRASVGRIDALIARLRHGEEAAAATAEGAGAPSVAARLRALAQRPAHPVEVEATEDLPAPAMPPENFDAAVTHLLNNAAEASPPGAPVRLRARREGARLVVEIEDRGAGMTAEFLRDELFRPLSTTKRGGSGIGAWQARELLAQAGGALEVESRPGSGTLARLRVPTLAGARALAETGPA